MTRPVDDAPPACGGCELGRRAFVVTAAQAAAAILGVTLLAPLANALPVGAGEAGGAMLEERRYPLPATDGVAVDETAGVILARSAGVVYAFNLKCPHKGTALRWQEAAGRFQCPKHKSRYQPDGVFISGRATRSMDRHAIRRDGAIVIVDPARLFREDLHPREWEAACVRVA